MQGMEVYSTVLWHLRREAELAALARECLALDRRAPASWAAAGNALSLQKVCCALPRLLLLTYIVCNIASTPQVSCVGLSVGNVSASVLLS